MGPIEADGYRESPAAYVHIPFCSAVCPYCDFAVVAGRDDMAKRYADAVVAEIGMSEPGAPLQSVYFGGGTPSHVESGLLESILAALERCHGIAGGAEVSLEANPEDFTLEKARSIRKAGFNRVSFGAQSLDGEVLLSLGRRHDPEDVPRSIDVARRAGFENVSVDLIYGTPGETAASWESTVEGGLKAAPDHVSCYALTVEPGTPLAHAVRDGGPEPDADDQASFYEIGDLMLTGAGYERYEVSNWSLPGHECAYNLTVWAQGEYEAYGNGAHRFVSGVRSRNPRRLDTYLDEIESGTRPVGGAESIIGWEAEIDRLFVGLRRAVGVSESSATTAFIKSDEGKRLLVLGIVERGQNRLRIATPLLTDAVLRVVLGLEDPTHRHGTDNV